VRPSKPTPQPKAILFLVTGAIHSTGTKFTPLERARQTILTLTSIKRKVPDAKIVYIDAGLPFFKFNRTTLTSVYKIYRHSYRFINLTRNKDVVKIQKKLLELTEVPFEQDGRLGLYKSMLEVLCYEKAISKINQSWSRKFRYLFKLSGRYELTESFVLDDYLDKLQSCEFIFAAPKKTYLTKIGIEYPFYYSTVLWSGRIESQFVLEKVIGNCKLVLERCRDDNTIIDLEHVMFASTRSHLVAELDCLGVKGDISTNGKPVSL
jgi:hypothetical protein